MMDRRPLRSIPSMPINTWQRIKPFFIGGVSGMIASIWTMPIDTIKIRIQCHSEKLAFDKSLQLSTKTIRVFKYIMKQEGYYAFFKGLDAAILRQLIYATVRLGIYRTISDDHKRKTQQPLNFQEKIIISLLSGWLAGYMSNPADISLIRVQVDNTLPMGQRRNYKNVIDAIQRTIKEEGILTLWRGSPTVVRSGFINMGLLAPYDEIKERINRFSGTVDTIQTRLLAACFSAIIASMITLPFDNVKTKIQKMTPNAITGEMPYKGFFDCIFKVSQTEGFFGLWVGLPAFIIKLCSHGMTTLLIQDLFYILSQKYNF